MRVSIGIAMTAIVPARIILYAESSVMPQQENTTADVRTRTREWVSSDQHCLEVEWLQSRGHDHLIPVENVGISPGTGKIAIVV